jgi:ADP-heptose:LPS heptosyltransferase
MVPDLTSCADHVVLELEPRLIDLFARSFPHMRIVPTGSGVCAAEANAQAPMAGLARVLRPNGEAFPRREQGFLMPDKVRATALRERLARDGRTVIGLSWKSRNQKFANARSARLLDFAAVLQLPNCRFIDLQYGDTRAEREAVAHDVGIHVEQLGDVDNSHDIDGLAALITACDIVVSVSNSTAHLAGAVGRPTWVFAPYGEARPWYWFEAGRESPWYPYLRVKHQAAGQSWADLISRSAGEIW